MQHDTHVIPQLGEGGVHILQGKKGGNFDEQRLVLRLCCKDLFNYGVREDNETRGGGNRKER